MQVDCFELIDITSQQIEFIEVFSVMMIKAKQFVFLQTAHIISDTKINLRGEFSILNKKISSQKPNQYIKVYKVE